LLKIQVIKRKKRSS